MFPIGPTWDPESDVPISAAPSCPPHAPARKDKERAGGLCLHALLLEGEPPTRDFQKRVLAAEREAFLAGFYKAFAYWAGPCSICPACAEDGTCRNTKRAGLPWKGQASTSSKP